MAFQGRVPAILASLLLFGSIQDTRAQSALPLPQDHEGIVDQLIMRTRTNQAANVALVKAKPEETFEVVREYWNILTSDNSKQQLLYAFVLSENPHLLEVLNMGATDSHVAFRQTAFLMIERFALRDFTKDPAAYRTWYAGTVGKPMEDVVAKACTAFIVQYSQADNVKRASMCDTLISTDFSETNRLGKARRRAALDAGLLSLIEKTLTTPIHGDDDLYVVLQTSAVLHRLKPDEAFIKRVIVPLTAKNTQQNLRNFAISIVGTVKSTWASDLLFNYLMEDNTSSDRWALTTSVATGVDPHLIPKLIALSEAEASFSTIHMLSLSLVRLTGNKAGADYDGPMWHDWWESNKTNFPPDVQAVSYPKFKVVKRPLNGFFLRRQTEKLLVEYDPKRTYRLIFPGYNGAPIIVDGPQQTIGLIVVLADGDGTGEDLSAFWKEAIQNSLRDGYIVALPIAPKWTEHQPTPWITQQNIGQVKEARFSTEAFLKDIVEDVSKHYPIDPKRILLHGVGEGGLAAYGCSLAPSTPFQGFYILASPFKTAQLPPLANATGRRYLIQASKEDKVAPYFQALAADDLLRKQAAVVKMETIKGEHGYKFADDPWDHIRQAIKWLEPGH